MSELTTGSAPALVGPGRVTALLRRVTAASSRADADSWTMALGLASAAAFLVAAIRNKAFDFEAESVGWAVGALLCVAVAIGARTRVTERLGAIAVAPLLCAAVVLMIVYTLTHGGAVRVAGVPATEHLFPRVALGLGAALALGLLVIPGERLLAVIKGALVVIAFSLSAWVAAVTPHSPIDFDLMTRESIRALTQGVNPYGLTFPLPYADLAFHYGAGMYDEATRRSTFGYPYPPLTLYLVAPAELLAGDYRYALAAAHALAGALIAYVRPWRVAGLAAALFLLNPRQLFIAHHAWSEPLVVSLLAVTVVAAVRVPRLVPPAFGLFLAVKQYAVLALPVFAVIGPRLSRRGVAATVGIALIVALVVSLPLAVGDPAGFVRSLVELQAAAPFRPDSISIPALLWATGFTPTNELLAFAAAGAASLLVALRSPRTAAGLASAILLVLLAFFLFAKQAHVNYYYFLLGAATLAVASVGTAAAGGPDAEATHRSAA